MRYAPELPDDHGDIATAMPANVAELATAVVGHRIVSVEEVASGPRSFDYAGALITLDNGKAVRLLGTKDCCAGTDLENFLLHPELVDHIITGVGTTDGFTTWHIYADMGDVLSLKVNWYTGDYPSYIYGFSIHVEDAERAT